MNRHTGKMGAGILGAVAWMSSVLGTAGTSAVASHSDPSIYVGRAVSAAGGSATQVAVRFTVRPAILLVVDEAGRTLQIWSNVGHRPSFGDLEAITIRLARPNGTTLAASTAILHLAAAPLAASHWDERGLIWHD